MHKFWENPVSAIAVPQDARSPESLQVGTVRIEPPTILAPMAGVTDTVFRRFIRNASFVHKPATVMALPPEYVHGGAESNREKSGCGLIMTEFTSADGRSGLLKDLPVIGRIFETIRAAVTIPFTVKFRMGWDDSNLVCVELARMAEECGINAVALHARTREQGYSGQARWEWIAAVKDA